MKTADMRPVLLGHIREVRERHHTQAAARRARDSARVVLRGLKDRVAAEAPAERISSTSVYVDPRDPLVLVCSCDPKPVIPSPYQPVLSLAVGQSCTLSLPRTRLSSVFAKLQTMAAEAEEEIGTRPTWRAEWPQPGVFVVTRLPDDYDPFTGKPRERLTGSRRKAQQRDLERMNRLLSAYEYGLLYEAVGAGNAPPPIPEELVDLMQRHAPKELDNLRRRVAEASQGPAAVMARLEAERQETAPC